MRLLNVRTKKLRTFDDRDLPRYAILSHTWFEDDSDEVTFAQIQNLRSCSYTPGYRKVEFLCDQAKLDGYKYGWIDTCCIDKGNSTELGTALNSMFNWYRNAGICYAYLSDVGNNENIDSILKSRWWTRAWTLQEFLAARNVVFYSKDWTSLGTKSQHAHEIARSVGIDEKVLRDPSEIFHCSVAQRMSWAARREAKRVEDRAYSLLGIFAVNMPLLYGVGDSAFHRLQQEILRNTHDHSLFAWGYKGTQLDWNVVRGTDIWTKADDLEFSTSELGLFASSPDRFENCGDIVPCGMDTSCSEIRYYDGAIHLEMKVISCDGDKSFQVERRSHLAIGLLSCRVQSNPGSLVGILLWSENYNSRCTRLGTWLGVVALFGYTLRVHVKDATEARLRQLRIDAKNPSTNLRSAEFSSRQASIVLENDLISAAGAYEVVGRAPSRWSWTPSESTFHLARSVREYDCLTIALYSRKLRHMLCVLIAGRFLRHSARMRVNLFSETIPEARIPDRLQEIRRCNSKPSKRCDPVSEGKTKLNGFTAEVIVNNVAHHFIYTLKLSGSPALDRETLQALLDTQLRRIQSLRDKLEKDKTESQRELDWKELLDRGTDFTGLKRSGSRGGGFENPGDGFRTESSRSETRGREDKKNTLDRRKEPEDPFCRTAEWDLPLPRRTRGGENLDLPVSPSDSTPCSSSDPELLEEDSNGEDLKFQNQIDKNPPNLGSVDPDANCQGFSIRKPGELDTANIESGKSRPKLTIRHAKTRDGRRLIRIFGPRSPPREGGEFSSYFELDS